MAPVSFSAFRCTSYSDSGTMRGVNVRAFASQVSRTRLRRGHGVVASRPTRFWIGDWVEASRGRRAPLISILCRIRRRRLVQLGSPQRGEAGGMKDKEAFLNMRFCETNRIGFCVK